MAEEGAALNKKVLIIDDDGAFTESLSQWLRGHGLEADTASTGEEGIEKARSWLPGLIVMDIMMPGIHGLQALRELRADPATAGIPVMVFTCVIGRDREIEAAQLNAEFFPKTMDPVILAKKIWHRLSRLS